MAHPMNEHRGHKVERERVSHIAGKHAAPKHYARGGSVHEDEAEDKALIHKEVKGEALKHEGKGARHRGDKAVRRAKGGHVKHHGKGGGKTSVNVIVAPSGGKPPMPMPTGGPAMGPPPMGAAPPPMPPKPPMVPPPGAPPMAGLGGPPMPPHARGGRAYKKGGAVSNEKGVGKKSLADKKGVTGIGERTPIQHSGNKSDTQNIGRGKPVTYAKGGSVESEFTKAENWDAKANKPAAGKAQYENGWKAHNRPTAVIRATGGPIYADGREGKQMAPEFGGGGGGGTARKDKAHREAKGGHEPWEDEG